MKVKLFVFLAYPFYYEGCDVKWSIFCYSFYVIALYETPEKNAAL